MKLILIVFLLFRGLVAQPTDFILNKKEPAKKQLSMNQLKEQCGDALRETIYETTRMLKEMSNVHVGVTKSLAVKTEAITQEVEKNGEQPKSEPIPLITLDRSTVLTLHYAGATTGLLALVHERCSKMIESLINNDKSIKKIKRETITSALDAVKQAHEQLHSMDESLKSVGGKDMKLHYVGVKKIIDSFNAIECLKNV